MRTIRKHGRLLVIEKDRTPILRSPITGRILGRYSPHPTKRRKRRKGKGLRRRKRR